MYAARFRKDSFVVIYMLSVRLYLNRDETERADVRMLLNTPRHKGACRET